MMKRILSFLLGAALIIALACPVMAAESNVSGWIELLEFTSIQQNGDNTFTMGSTGSVAISVYGEKHLRKVDLLLWNPSGQRPTSASVTAAGKTNNLDIHAIGGNLTRIVGYIPDAFYELIRIDLKKGTSSVQSYEVLSWKVTPVGVQEFVCDANVYLQSYDSVGGTYSTNYLIPLWYDENANYSDGSPWLARVTVNDWEKYDSLSVWGSAYYCSIESIRVSVGTTALDFSINYMDPESYEIAIDGDPAYWATSEWGQYLFNLTVDLDGVDRTQINDPLYIYFTGTYDMTVKSYFNCQYVNGSITTADTTSVTWWNRFTDFFTGLLGGDSDKADDFESDMEQLGQDVQDSADIIESVTRPAIEDVDVDITHYLDADGSAQIGSLFGDLLSNNLLVTMISISLMVGIVGLVIFGRR